LEKPHEACRTAVRRIYKIAVIIQQIYARYVRGHTRDARFARLNELVAALCQAELLAVKRGRF
jgi:hypothetical protein